VAQPTILGVPDSLAQYQLTLLPEKRFQWAAAANTLEIPWQSLNEFGTGGPDSPVPVVMDMNTAAWSLHQGASLGAITRITIDDREIYFKTVGLLSNSIMQGRLLISESNFAKLFPEQSGFRFFLIHSEDHSLSEVTHALENGWSDQGLDATSTALTLAKMLAVQNTYISAFQAIGALGLLLGTIGLAIVQVRSVLERRRELALLQAIGFSRPRIAQLLLGEALILLCGGLIIGVLSAFVAIVPYMLSSNPQLNALEPLLLLGIVLAVGLLASTLAIVIALRQPLLSNLRQ
jgi:ABC-type antimicrobial peptide transport system permease subunit